MQEFYQFWSELGWLANLFGICLVVFPLVTFANKSFKYLKEIHLNKINSHRYQLNKKMNSDEYLNWQLSFFKKTYSASAFTILYGREYPATIIRTNNEHQYPFEDLCSLESTDIEYLKFDRIQRKYLKYLGDSVKRPKMKGFCTKEIFLSPDGLLNYISARATTYDQSLATSHILEWELYRFYERKNGKNANIDTDLKMRAKYHGSSSPSSAILKPCNAFPLISVQALVIYKDYKYPDNIEWKAVIAQRGKNVSVKPELWQMQPAGGFEVFGHEQDDNNILLEQAFDIRTALLREYAEELYNVDEFSFCADGRDSSSILSEMHVSMLIELINKKSASFDFLGLVTDLTVLRHEVSFLIVIDDKEYSKLPIFGSSESIKITSLNLQEIKRVFSKEKIHSSSAGLLQLAIESDRLINLGISDQLK
jgi:hypothetical protein